MADLLEIDGSVLEGGGQILRNSISLSAILGIPVKVFKIRAGRSKPGLAAQHLKGIQLVAEMCQAKLKGDYIGSTDIQFIPGKIKGGHYLADTQTAGSISLLLQVALPCALLADGPVTLDLRGGTNAEMAPQIDYITQVFRPMLQKFGADFQLTIHRRGYFPRGGGHVTAHVTPVRSLRAVELCERGSLLDIRGRSFVAGTLPIKLAYEMSDGAKSELRAVRDADIDCCHEQQGPPHDNCSGIIVTASLSSGCVLGSSGLCGGGRGGRGGGGRGGGGRGGGGRGGGGDARGVGAAAGAELRACIESGACLDSYAQDQVIVYMSLARGRSRVLAGHVTLHASTAVHVAQLIAKTKFYIEPVDNNNIIECTGLGFINKNLPPD